MNNKNEVLKLNWQRIHGTLGCYSCTYSMGSRLGSGPCCSRLGIFDTLPTKKCSYHEDKNELVDICNCD